MILLITARVIADTQIDGGDVRHRPPGSNELAPIANRD